ncbi:MAG: 16S rRNA (uracil(1498)-N(3))-methyltransferase, partial [Hyphomicrobiales bacterium]|nr:16S rRNA (uracil(1498)-N(3))-methyltransferase [Hyphomicrobiales bacterium]
LDPGQANYLVSVLRLKPGGRALAFNGRDGEFLAALAAVSRKGATLALGAQTRPPETPGDLDYLFAPLKHARLDYMAQKAVEMGVRRLKPVLTARTQVKRVNLERLTANAIEACEQCGRVFAPEVAPPEPIEQVLAQWPAERLLVFCDEEARAESPIAMLSATEAPQGAGLFVGPEGGFDDKERAAILRLPRIVRLSLGPRVLRADTAAVAALALIQATLGDWARHERWL